MEEQNTKTEKQIPEVLKQSSRYWIPLLAELIIAIYRKAKELIKKKKKEETLNNK
jgi:hypothetical protein